MLSYLHAFHAGNFADIHKHSALVLTLAMMQRKASPIACFDTHAGSALYRLDSERALKTGEAQSGILKLWPQRDRFAAKDWDRFLELLMAMNPGTDRLTRYPGSPAWLQHLSRPQDSLTVFELHPAEGQSLEQWGQGTGVRVMRQDGLKGLLRALPPREPRLLALMDPSYEVKSEYAEVAATLERAWKKCRHGVFLIWYPLLASGLEKGLKETVRKSGVTKVLCSEVYLNHPPERGMTGSGMLVVNPPWGFEGRYSAMLEDAGQPSCLDMRPFCNWLVPEV